MSVIHTDLASLLHSLNVGSLQLPEIQRDFVWKQRQKVIDLFDSLYRGFPIGAILVWRSSLVVETKPWHKGSVPGHAESQVKGYLLDGQQRLTAIRKVMDGEFPLRFDLDSEVFEWESKRNNKTPTFVDVAEVLMGKIGVPNVLEKLRDVEKPNIQYELGIEKTFNNLRAILTRDVPVMEYPSDDYAAATDLFIRFNSGGVRLKPADLAIAELAKRAPQMVTKELHKFSSKWSEQGFEFTIPFLARCLVAARTGQVRFRDPHKIWDAQPAELRRDWKATKKAITATIKFLTGTMNWDSSEWIPSFNALIPIVCLFAWRKKKGQYHERDLKVIRRWLAAACLCGKFSGAAETTLDRVLGKLEQKRNPKGLLSTLSKRDRKRISSSDLDEASRRGSLMSIYYSMLRQKDARDWFTGNKLEGSVVGHNADIEVHHVFPRAVLRDARVAPRKINHFANYALLEKGSNIEILDDEPAKYLPTIRRGKKKLPAQCIPSTTVWWVKTYDKFLRQRRQLMIEALNGYLGL